jgi:hypothetical protein
MHDKTFWKDIANTQFNLPIGYTAADLTPELMEYLGSPDAELRDEIGVDTLTSWIVGGHYEPDALRKMMGQWIENLRKEVGEQGTNSVLLRSFSALMLSVITYHDWKTSFLTDAEVKSLLERALEYMAAEKDVRGYEDSMGWLHSAAHTADLLKFLARNPKTNADDHRRILTAVADKVTEPRTHVFVHSQYERLGLTVLDVVKRSTVSQNDLTAWLGKFTAVKAKDPGKYDPGYHAMYQNTKHFLRSVYFTLAHQEEPIAGAHDLQAQIFEALKQFRT